MDDPFWSFFLRSIAVGLVFALLHRFFPARIADDAEAPLTDEEHASTAVGKSGYPGFYSSSSSHCAASPGILPSRGRLAYSTRLPLRRDFWSRRIRTCG